MRFRIALLIMGVFLGAAGLGAGAPYFQYYPCPGATRRVGGIVVDAAGVKWFGNSHCEVWRYDESSWQRFSFGTSFNMLYDMDIDEAGRVWLALFWGPLYYVDKGEVHRFDPGVLDLCSAVGFSPDGALWASGLTPSTDAIWGTEMVGRYSFSEGAWQRLWRNYSAHPGAPSLGLAFGPDGDAWCVDTDSVYRFSAGSGSFERYKTGYLHHVDLAIGVDGDMWLASACGERPEEVVAILESVDGESWGPVPDAHVRDMIEQCWRVKAVPGEGVWFVCSTSKGSRGALWFDYANWRWIALPQLDADLAVDSQTGDLWFSLYSEALGCGLAVMRGGPDAWPPVWTDLKTAAQPGAGAHLLSVIGSAEFQMELNLDLYVAVELPDGRVLFAPGWTPGAVPFLAGITVPIGLVLEDFPLLTMDASDLKPGNYRFYAAFTYTGTMDLASNIASCEWEFEK